MARALATRNSQPLSISQQAEQKARGSGEKCRDFLVPWLTASMARMKKEVVKDLKFLAGFWRLVRSGWSALGMREVGELSCRLAEQPIMLEKGTTGDTD
jgi:hypothetical protein